MPGILWVRRNQEHNLIGTTTTQIHDKNIYEFLIIKNRRKMKLELEFKTFVFRSREINITDQNANATANRK